MDILDLLPTDDLFSVCSVSKVFHVSTKPFLYRTISWQWDVVPMIRILRLLRAILQNQELALHVHHVKIICSPDRLYIKVWEAPWHEMD